MVYPSSSNKRPGIYWRAVLKEDGVYKMFGFFDFTSVQNKHKKP